MALELLCGPANSGKVRAVVDRVLAGCRDHGGAWLVVPTAADIRRGRQEVAMRGGGLVLGARVGTFHHLVRELAGDPQVDTIDAAGELVLVRRLLEGSDTFRGSLGFEGFVATARKRLLDLRAAQAAGDASLRERLALLPSGEQHGWRDLLDRFERTLSARSLHDDVWFERRALREVELARVGGALVPVHAYGFDDLDELQVRLLLAAARTVDVSISLPFVRGRTVFARRQGLVDRLVGAGAIVLDSGEPAVDSPVLRALEERLYEPTADPIDVPAGSDCDVRFVTCCGELQQAEQVVREVGMLLREGIDPGEIACLTARPAASRAVLEAAFQRAGVPVTFEVARTVHDTPAGRAVLQALEAAITGAPTAAAAFAHSRISGVPRDAVDAWEQSSAQRRAMAGTARAAALATWRDEPWLPPSLRDLARLRPASRELAAVEAVRAVVGTAQPAAGGDVRLLGAIDELVVRLATTCDPTPPSLIELRDAIAAMPIPAPQERTPGAVVVAPVTRVRTDRFTAVVVYDLHSGGFGAGGVEEDEAPLVARELAYIAFTRAWARATFVRQAAGSDGRLRAAHPIWLELRRLLPTVEVHRRGLDAVVCAAPDAVYPHELAAAVALASGEGARITNPVAARLVPPAPAPREPDAGDEFRTEIAEHGRLRVTDVEGYAGCSARWFVQRHLLPRDPAGPSRRQVVGMLVHEALAELVPSLAVEEGHERTVPDGAQVEAALLAATGTLPRAAVLRPTDRATARAIVERFLRDEVVLGTRSLSEVPFGGPDDPIPAPVVGGMPLTGRIDRIDVDAGGRAVVHDYKLSRSTIAGAKLVAEGRLQAPLYWHALRAAPDLEPVGALYRPLEATRPRGILDRDLAPEVAGQYRPDRFDEEALEALLDAAMEESERAVAGIRAGVVEPSPRGGECPSWCELQAICRVEAR